MNKTSTTTKENYIYNSYQVGNEPPALTPFQTLLAPHTDVLIFVLWIIWILTLLVVVKKLLALTFNSNS